jgi:LPXTG-motif cell wall-anchored protein
VPVITPLPRTGRGTDSLIAWLGAALLVGGAGLLGTVRRRRGILTSTSQ